jgi:hypothetical protein
MTTVECRDFVDCTFGDARAYITLGRGGCAGLIAPQQIMQYVEIVSGGLLARKVMENMPAAIATEGFS